MSAGHVLVCWRSVPAVRGEPHQVTRGLGALGLAVQQAGDDPAALADARAVVLVGAAGRLPAIAAALACARPRPPVALWLNEPLPAAGALVERLPCSARELAKIVLRDPRANDARSVERALRGALRAGWLDVVAVQSEEQAERARALGAEVLVTPWGYEPSLGRDLELVRDVPVLFLGALDTPRRRRLVRRLRRAGVPLEVAGSWRDPATWGEERTRLLNRTRILLDLHRRPGTLSGLRQVLGMANGALVVGEPIRRPEPFVPGEHLVTAPVDELPAAIARLLADEPERARLAAAGRRLVTQELRLERTLAPL
ncbi:MAG: glycosyltransferase, partial [Thermoleophilia bacterium]